MISLAFKSGATAIQRDTVGYRFLAQSIMERTGGPYVHVELWLEGPQKTALCYSAREDGTSMQFLDLSDEKLWTIVPILNNPELERYVYYYAMGSCGKPYDSLGILGIGWDAPKVHDDRDRFCSEACFEALQKAGGLFANLGPRWMVAPSGKPHDALGLSLFDLAFPYAEMVRNKLQAAEQIRSTSPANG